MFDSVKVLYKYAPDIYQAHSEVLTLPNMDAIACSEAKSLQEEVHSFSYSIVIWYDILSQVIKVSKLMQSIDTELEMQ